MTKENRFEKWKIGEENKPLNENESAIKNFDDLLGSSSNKSKDQFFRRGRHTILDIKYLSRSYYDLPKELLERIVI